MDGNSYQMSSVRFQKCRRRPRGRSYELEISMRVQAPRRYTCWDTLKRRRRVPHAYCSWQSGQTRFRSLTIQYSMAARRGVVISTADFECFEW